MADSVDDRLYRRVSEILSTARRQANRSINTAMVQAYWLIGREIVEVQQAGKSRAGYGHEKIHHLSKRLTERYGQGFTSSSLKRMRQFYSAYPNGSPLLPEASARSRDSTAESSSVKAVRKGATPWHLFAQTPRFSPALSWSHYRLLIRIRDRNARSFYELEASKQNWTVRELERQMASLLFERLALSRSPTEVRHISSRGQDIQEPKDLVKDPLVLEFLGLEERAVWREQDLEQAIVDRMESFLLELGKGFCFVARQKRISIDGDHFYVDLVFYNRLLRCFVLIDLKLGKLTHQDLGQIQMYVNWFDRTQITADESPTVGIVLCSAKNDAMVQITLPESNRQVHASRYQLYLPNEEELRAELMREREQAERAVRSAAEGGRD